MGNWEPRLLKKKWLVCSFYPGKLIACWQITFWQLSCNLKHASLETLNNKVFPGIDSYSFIFLCICFQWIQEINWSIPYSLCFLNNSEMYPHLKNLTCVNLITVLMNCGVRKEHKLLKWSDLGAEAQFCHLQAVRPWASSLTLWALVSIYKMRVRNNTHKYPQQWQVYWVGSW